MHSTAAANGFGDWRSRGHNESPALPLPCRQLHPFCEAVAETYTFRVGGLQQDLLQVHPVSTVVRRAKLLLVNPSLPRDVPIDGTSARRTTVD
jgi:hypothetical protein